MQRRYLLALLVASGSTGLIYESIWVRLLSLSFGSTTLSFSAVLAVFFGGLAIGAFVGGRMKRALERPARSYALLEIFTGVSALLIHPLLVALPSMFAAIDPGPGLAGSVARLLVAIPLLGVPTLLMGATLPMVTAACIREEAEIMRGTARIYGANTLGACFGAYAVPYLLLPTFGAFGSTLAAAIINVSVGATVLLAERRGLDVQSAEAPSAKSANDAEQSPDPVVRLGLVLAFLGGLAAISIQVVWSRLFSIFLEGTIYGVSAVLISVLLGIGAGSLMLPRLSAGISGARAYCFAQLALAASLWVLLACVPWLKYQLETMANGLTGLPLLHAQLLLTVVALGVPSAASGVSLPLLVRMLESDVRLVPRALGRLYASNTVGSIVGSLLAGFVMLPVLGTEGTWYISAILVVVMGAVAAALLERQSRAVALGFVLSQLAIVGAFPGFDARAISMRGNTGVDYWTFRKDAKSAGASLAYFHEGEVASVAVSNVEGTNGTARGLQLNALGQGSWSLIPPHHILESLLVAQVPYNHTPAHPKNALVVGLGAGATADALIQLGAQHVEVLELEPAVLEAVRLIHGSTSTLLSDPRLELVVNDARHHLLIARRERPRSFDLITSMPAHPWVASSIFTREFFELAHDNLTDAGVFSTWFGSGKMTAELLGSLFRAFASVFPYYVIYEIPEVGAHYLVGSRSPLILDPARFSGIAANPVIHLQQQRVDELMFFASRIVATGSPDGPGFRPGPINRDDNALVELFVPRTGTAAASFPTEEFPRAGVSPDVFPLSERSALLVGVAEELLGTPGGKLAYRPSQAARPIVIDRLLASAQTALTEQQRTYLDGRRLLASGKPAEAQAMLRRSASGPDPVISARSRRFAAAATVSDTERIAELAAVRPSSSDIWLRLLALGAQEEALSLARASGLAKTTTASVDDPLGWLVARSTVTERFTPEERRAFVELVGPALKDVDALKVLELCERVARAEGLSMIAADCRGRARAANERTSGRRLSEAISSGSMGQHEVAVTKFGQVMEEKPLDLPAMYLMLESALRAKATDRAQEIVEALLFRGVPRIVIDIRVARMESAPR